MLQLRFQFQFQLPPCERKRQLYQLQRL